MEEKLDGILHKPISALVWSFGFLGIISARLFIDNFIAETGDLAVGNVIDLHNFFFFLIMLLLIWLCLSLFLKQNTFSLSRLMLWAALLIIFPPLIDIIKTGGSVFWSFYLLNDLRGLWGQFVTVFGNLPPGNVYFGTKVTFIGAVVMVLGLIYLKTKSPLKALSGAFFVYVLLFFMGSLPSWISFIYYFFQGSISISDINPVRIVQFLGVPYKIFGLEIDNLSHAFSYNLNLIYFLFLLFLLLILFFSGSRKQFLAFLKNSRLPQVIYHVGLFFAGLGLGFLAYPENLNLNIFSISAVLVLISSIWLAWEASVIFNDIYDYKIDEVSNPERPLQKKVFEKEEYRDLGLILFALSLAGGLAVGTKFMATLLAYQVLAWFYSGEPYRLKKFPVIATLVSAVASLLILFLGFILFSNDQNIHGLSFRIILLLIVSLTLSLPVKDFKDIAGDKKYGVFTVPVIFGEEKGRLIVASGVFTSFILSVLLLNEFRLFWWAMLFGVFSFLIIAGGKKTKSRANSSEFSAWIRPRNLFWWVLGTVSAYGLILIKIIFIKM